MLLPRPCNNTINSFMVWTLHLYCFVNWFAVGGVYLPVIRGYCNVTQLRESGCKHTVMPRRISTATNLQKQANKMADSKDNLN